MSYPPSGAPPAWHTPPPPQDVVVGEAVALHLRLAKLPSRALAFVVDLGGLAVALLFAGGIAGAVAAESDDALAAAVVLGTIVVVIVGWPVTWETLTRGRSPGKMLLGLRVVREDGGPIRFRHAFTRALAGVFVDFNPLLLGAPAVITSLCSTKGKRVGDLLAGTVVIRERVPQTVTPPLVMPDHLLAWAAGLPVTRIPDHLALQARSVLARRDELDPAQAQYWTNKLAGEVLAELGAAPPPGSDPVTVLATVLTERRNRELARAGWVAPGPGQGWIPAPTPPPAAGSPSHGWDAPPRLAPTPAYGGGWQPAPPPPPSPGGYGQPPAPAYPQAPQAPPPAPPPQDAAPDDGPFSAPR